MSRARDLADLIGGGFTEADIPNLSASKITSGTFADARIAASNVSQHATSFDDNKIVNDISTLGLRVHTQENLTASNTSSASFDTFQDSSGITNLTNTARNDSEYISTVNEVLGTSNSNQDSYLNDSARSAIGMPNQYGTNPALLYDGVLGGNNGMIYWVGSDTSPSPSGGIPQFTGTLNYDDGVNGVSGYHPCFFNFMGNSGSPKTLINGSTIDWYSRETSGRINGHYWIYQGLDNTWYQMVGTGNGNTSGTWGVGNTLGSSNSDGWNGITYTGSPVAVKAIALLTTSHQNGNLYPGIQEFSFEMADYTLTANATGSFENNPITASSTNKMGAVITYQDNAGTNTLNTDIILKLSADNGSNYSTATLTALPDFATGIKMAKVNDLTIANAGTSLKYKIEFANQSSGSKEARIRGVSLQY